MPRVKATSTEPRFRLRDGCAAVRSLAERLVGVSRTHGEAAPAGSSDLVAEAAPLVATHFGARLREAFAARVAEDAAERIERGLFHAWQVEARATASGLIYVANQATEADLA